MKREGKMSKHGKKVDAPFNFVPINSALSLQDKPTSRARFDQTKNSGELLLSMSCLTPFLPGHFQYKFQDMSSSQQQEINIKFGLGKSNFDKDKNIIEPLFHNIDGKEHVLVAGTSLKGMLRNSLASLFSNPMERVNKRTYSFRPNIKPGNIVPAIVVDKEGPWDKIKVKIGNMNNFHFCSDECEDSLASACSSSNLESDVRKKENKIKAKLQKCRHLKQRFCNKLIPGGNENIDLIGSHIGKYFFGIDGKGLLKQKFNPGRNKKYGFGVGKFKKEITLEKKLIEGFKRTLEHLCCDEYGHLKDHPLLHGSNAGVVKKEIKAKVRTGPEIGDIVFLEYKPNCNTIDFKDSDFITMGFHYRYRWAYQDNTREKFAEGQLKNRSAFFDPNPGEDQEFTPQGKLCKTTVLRELFGFVDEEKEFKGKEAKGSQKALAGKLSCNFAIEQNPERNNRFLFEEKDYFCVLKPLGSPKPSAVELYLTQREDLINKRKDGGFLCTYGENHNDAAKGSLRGRKFYLNHTNNFENFICKTSSFKEFAGQHTSLARYVLQKGTDFKFKLRFENLSDWELGAIIFALKPAKKWFEVFFKRLNEKELNKVKSKFAFNKVFVHKLGHARPLGLGSVSFQIDKTRIWDLQNKFQPLFKDKDANFEKYIEAFANYVFENLGEEEYTQWMLDILYAWLKVHEFAHAFHDYPKGSKGTTISYHSDIRQEHALERKKEKSQNKKPSGLKTL
jgi:CRISPR-associated protein (TIGR03986 family)